MTSVLFAIIVFLVGYVAFLHFRIDGYIAGTKELPAIPRVPASILVLLIFLQYALWYVLIL